MNRVKPRKFKQNPVEDANIASSLLYLYLFPIFKKSFKYGFSESDLVEPLTEHKSSTLGDKLQTLWIEEQERCRSYSLHRVLIKKFGLKFVCYGIVDLINELMYLMVLFFSLRKVVIYFHKEQKSVSDLDASLSAFTLVLSRFIFSIVNSTTSMELTHYSMQIEACCMCLIYKKVLKLNQSSNVKVGQVLSLMSNELSKFQRQFFYFPTIVVAPLKLIFGTYLLYQDLELSAVAGSVALLGILLFQVCMVKLSANIWVKIVVKTAERIRLVDELISGIQFIKMSCWENIFAQLITGVRSKEMKSVFRYLLLLGLVLGVNVLASKLAIFVSFSSEALRGRPITAEKVFTASAILFTVRYSLLNIFMACLSKLIEANVSLQKIETFLCLDEHRDDVLAESVSDPEIVLQNVSAKWWLMAKTSAVRNVNLRIKNSQLVALTGPVGSGKSSLFSVLLKELDLESGSVDVRGTISYCSQDPWFFPGNVRQNILFNNEMDEERYQQVVELCALPSDLKMFPFGDQTPVSDYGKSLSGGQKCRISLARCLYRKADIYLLDDPLSSVDPTVGKHLFRSIKDFLKDKICILITHQLQYLKSVDNIIVMEKGKITMMGSYDELHEKDLVFRTLLGDVAIKPDTTDHAKTKPKTISTYNGNILVEKENTQRKMGTWALYYFYFRLGGLFNMLRLVFTFILVQVIWSSADYFLAYWVIQEKDYSAQYNHTNVVFRGIRNKTIYVYLGIVVVATTTHLLSIRQLMMLFTSSSTKLHQLCFSKIINATVGFFHKNTPGIILNRFLEDFKMLDQIIPIAFHYLIEIIGNTVGVVGLSAIVDFRQLLPAALLFLLGHYSKKIFMKTNKDCKRLECITRSPIYNHTLISLQGLSTIRAFAAQEHQIKIFDDHHDANISAKFLHETVNRCFALWVDLFCAVAIALVLLISFYFRQDFDGAMIGLLLSQYFSLFSSFQWGLRQWGEIETQVVCLERLHEYTNIPGEPVRPEATQISEIWPKEGLVEFRNVSLRYNEGQKYVLKNLNFTIEPKEKVGIVGRTGAGKSSLISTLFQVHPIEGSVLIDGLDVTGISLKQSRPKVSIIPQEPFLLSATMRKNLDPFDEYSDDVLWKALEEVELKNMIKEHPSGLHCKVTEKGANFSVGQRQLVCLARALVKKNKILVLDEATANVDPTTDELIQKSVRDKFVRCTVLTVAHRLNTVMDSDRILVMSDGKVEEFDHPFLLLQNKNGVFYSMVESTGRVTAARLKSLAEKNYLKKKIDQKSL